MVLVSPVASTAQGASSPTPSLEAPRPITLELIVMLPIIPPDQNVIMFSVVCVTATIQGNGTLQKVAETAGTLYSQKTE